MTPSTMHETNNAFPLYFLKAVDKLLDDLCAYKLRRREPFLAIGGGVLLDIAGMGACLYRRGVPFVRVPTTLLAIVDASVGVKNGVDYCCAVTDETYKNRVGAFYAPSACLLDPAFISTQDARNICNGFGEIMKLALVRSTDLFEILETHGANLVKARFTETALVPGGVGDRVIDLSIQIMLEELGPNLWEKTLERCVDYGTSTILKHLLVFPRRHFGSYLTRPFCKFLRSHLFKAVGDGPWCRHHARRSCQC